MAFHKFKDKKGNSYPHLYIDDVSGIFYCVARKRDKILKASLETTDFNEARAKLYDVLRSFDVTKSVPKTNKLLREYWDDLKREKIAKETKASTLKKIDNIWKNSISPYWGHLSAMDINQDEVTDFMIWHKENRPDVQFINVFKYLGNLFRFLHHRRLILTLPELELPKTEQRHHAKKKGRVITDGEFKEIISHLDARTKLIAQIAMCTGMRQMEIGSIERDQVEKLEGSFIFNLDTDDTKTGLARSIPIPRFLNSQIESYYQDTDRFLFKTKSGSHVPSQLIDKPWQKAKIKAKIVGRMRFHDLRHTCATRMAKQGVNPVIACTMLGMNLKTFQKTYLNLSIKDLIIASEALFNSLEGAHD